MSVLKSLWAPWFVFRVHRDSVMLFRGDTIFCGSAGLYSRILYVEILQGVDFTNPAFYRWLRVGITGKPALRILLARYGA